MQRKSNSTLFKICEMSLSDDYLQGNPDKGSLSRHCSITTNSPKHSTKFCSVVKIYTEFDPHVVFSKHIQLTGAIFKE